MAQTTAINFSLQAKDWEALVGIISQTTDSDILDIIFKLMTYYAGLVTKPLGATLIQVATSEGALVKISIYLYGNTIQNITQDVGGNMFNRVMSAIRAANNVADNYISTSLATNDANYANVAQAIRKSGRKTIMILQYDNN